MQFQRGTQNQPKRKQNMNNYAQDFEDENGEQLIAGTEQNQVLSPEVNQEPTSTYQAAKNDFKNNREKGDYNAEQPLPSLVVNIPRNGEEQFERSPKTINLGQSGDEPEYNIRTLNAKKSPKNYPNQPYRERESSEPRQERNRYYDEDFQDYQDGTGDSQPVRGGVYPLQRYSRSPQAYDRNRDISPYVNRTYGANQGNKSQSPNKYYEDTNSSGQPYISSRNVYGNPEYPREGGRDSLRRGYPQQLAGRSSTNPQKDEIPNRYNDRTYNTSYRDVKKIAGRFAKIYEPNKNNNGILLGDSQVTIPGADDELFNNRYRVLSKMNKLSNILLAKKRSPRKYEDTYTSGRPGDTSFNEGTRKTFNRKTMAAGDSKEKRRRNLSRSPDHKFLYVSLAMLSSKGPSCEDRPILRRMRLEKGGVVDLAQEEGKKGKFKIRKASPKKGGTRGYSQANPKYREKAAKIIQDWWRDLKDLYNDRLKKIIKIQSVWRGKFVRKYMYDLFYLNFLYISFCKKIESVLANHVRPYVMDKLMNRHPPEEEEEEEEEPEEEPEDINKLRNEILRKIIRRDYRNNLKKIYPYWRKWVRQLDKYKDINQNLRNVIQIIENKDSEKNKLKRAFDKWAYISKLLKKLDEIEENRKIMSEKINKDQDMDKLKGLFKILDGVDKLTKKEAMEEVIPKLIDYIKDENQNNKLKSIVDKKPKYDKNLLRKALYQWYANTLNDREQSVENDEKNKFQEIRDRVFLSKIDSFERKQDNKILRKYFNRYFRNTIKLAIEDDKDKVKDREKELGDLEDQIRKEYLDRLKRAEDDQKELEEELRRLRELLDRLKKQRDAEERNIKEKFATDETLLQQLEGCKILQRAVWRMTHPDVLDAFGDKVTWEKVIKVLRRIVKNKGNQNDNLLRKYFDRWRDRTFKSNKDLLNKLMASLLQITSDDYKRNLLRKKLYQWRNKCIDRENPYDNYKTCKGLIDLYETIHHIWVDHYGDEFLDRLDKTRNPIRYREKLIIIIRRLTRSDKDKLRRAFYKWRFITRCFNIPDLVSLYMYKLYDKYERRLWELLNKYFQIWKKKAEIDKIKRINDEIDDLNNDNISIRNKYVRTLIAKLANLSDEYLLRKYLKRWHDITEATRPKISLDEDKKYILIRKLWEHRKKDEYLDLLQYLLRWKHKVNEMNRKRLHHPYRNLIISIIMSKTDKGILRKYFNRWRYAGLKETPAMALLVGMRLLKRALVRECWEKFKKKMRDTDPKILRPKGKKLNDVLTKILRRKFEEFIDKLWLYILIKKLMQIQPKVHEKLKKYYLAKYFYRWVEKSLKENERRRNAYQEYILRIQKEEEERKKKRKQELLHILILRLSRDVEIVKGNTLTKWLKNAKLDTQIEHGTVIQDFCRKILKKALDRKADLCRKFIEMIIRLYHLYYIRQLLKFAQKNMGKINDYIRKKNRDFSILRIIIIKKEELRDEDLLRKYFEKWKRYLNLCNEKAAIIQRNVRNLFARSKRRALKAFYEFLLRSILNQEKNKEDLVRYTLLKWLVNAKRLECEENANIIQDFCRTRLNKLLRDKFKNLLYILAKKYVIKLINRAAKANELKKAIRKPPCRDVMEKLREYLRYLRIKKIMIKIVVTKDSNYNNLLLRYYLEKWYKKMNQLRQRDNDAASKIQALFRGYIMRKYFNIDRELMRRLLILFYKKDRDPLSFLRSAFRRWRKKTGELVCEENANIIQDFCRKILDKIKAEKERKRKEYYIILCQKIILIRPDPTDFFERLKLIRRLQILNELMEKLAQKRRDHLKWVLDNLRKVPKTKYLLLIRHIPGNFLNRLLRKYFERWMDRTWSKKRMMIILRSIFETYDNRNENIKRSTLHKWMYHARFRTQTENANIIQDFCRKIIEKALIRQKWRLLVIKLVGKSFDDDVNEIIRRIRIYFGLQKLKKPIVRHVREEVLDLLRVYYLKKLFRIKIKQTIITVEEESSLDLLRKYFEIWRNRAKLLKDREEGMNDLCEILEKLRNKKATPYVEYASIIKRLFALLPYIKALVCLRRLRDYANRNGENNALANDLIKANEEIKPQNDKILIKRLIKVYAYKVLDKLFDNLEKLKYLLARPNMRDFFKRLYQIKLLNSACSYRGRKENETQPKNSQYSFRLKKEPKNKIDRTRLLYVTCAPLLFNYLADLLKQRKRDAYDAIKQRAIDDRFCKLYYSWQRKRILKPKKDLVDALKTKAYKILSKGPLQCKLFILLRKYYIRRMIKDNRYIGRYVALIYLIKITLMEKKIAKERWLRHLIRRWRYLAFSRKLAANKMKKLYKNLHSTYLEMANCLFGEESRGNKSVLKEFERLGTDIGIWDNEEPDMKEEEKFVKKIETKYIFEMEKFDKYVSAVYPEEEKEFVKVEKTVYSKKDKRK